MADLNKWTPSDVLEPIRRFLDGDLTMTSIRVEQFLDGNTLVVRAEVPGLDPEKDVDVSVADGMLHIKAEREEKTEHKSKAGYRSEFRYGSFARSVSLPPGAREEDVTASYKDGVLEVRAPAPEQAPPAAGTRKIQITTEPGTRSDEPPQNPV
ncbi:Hsp20/alpha crystallin family protein [Arthrobacter sp. LjRoot14]|uniref:Hsp20/alpha crystallin family protein n=1 Tax=Arthrobacter sp. LjRoot14 TaxID=3342265 RepID=UPI003ECD7FEF